LSKPDTNPIVNDLNELDRESDFKVGILTHDLVERVKELNCLYGISRLVEKENLSLENILQGVVELIPPAWQYPEVTCACIKLKRKEFKTQNFKLSEWQQLEPLIINNRKVGILEVYYLTAKPSVYEGPFLKEERDLVHGIAERLGHIIESKNAEISLKSLYSREQRLRKKLQREMENRVNFTRQLVHELKTPLTSMVATSQLLYEETRNTRLEKLAGYAFEGANSFNKRIDEFQDVIRGEIGKLKLEIEPLNIEGLLVNLVDETKAFARQKEIAIDLELKGERLPDVLADGDRIRQIMLNLINNACKYAAEGGKIVIRANLDKLSHSVCIEVKDYGPGIPKEKRGSIFKPGYEKPEMSGKSGGLGIGLSLCKVLVDLHGGRIWLESAAGKGSCFRFTLPIASTLK
jgi:signal transduction histidine kinase